MSTRSRLSSWLCSSAILGGACLAPAATSLPAAAQSTDWTGAASSNWFDASNWTNGVPVAGGGAAAVDATAPNAPVVNAPGAAADVIAVGVGALGALTMTGGGTLSSVDGYVGYTLGSHGTVTVTGPGSNWSNSQDLYVGYFGTGTLTMEGGGTVSSLYGYVGWVPGSEGTVTVTGAGSTWTNSQNLFVGGAGTGTLTIADGATVSSVNGYVGSINIGGGTVTVTGTGSTWTNSGNLFVGDDGTGTLTIANGGTVSNMDGYIGRNAFSYGTVTVTGAGSTWINSGNLLVGDGGTGTLAIANGGMVSNTDGYLGRSAASHGTVTVTGAGSTWTNSGNLVIGDAGTGTLTIAAGGRASGAIGIVGNDTGSHGTVTVTGTGSTWTNGGNLFVGNAGTGALTIADGGRVSNAIGFVGFGAGSQGSVTVTNAGSAWSNSSSLTIGGGGTGVLAIENGGAVSNTSAIVGSANGSQGSVTVTGVGSTWTNSSQLSIGYFGVGLLAVASGGKVSSTYGMLGDFAGAQGTATVTGAGSAWANSLDLYVGNAGTGSLAVSNGGTVSNANGYVGYDTGSQGTVTVTGPGSAWNTSASLTIGVSGTGVLAIDNGGSVSSASAIIGSAIGSQGTVAVTGAGSTWTNSGDLYLGFDGIGTLSVAEGATVHASTVHVASQAGSRGTLNIGAAAGSPAAAAGTLDAASVAFGAGIGTINFNHTSANYVFGSTMTGNGSVNVLSGTTILTAANSYTGPTTVNGATLIVNGSIASSPLTVDGGGLVGGTGFLGATTIGAGTLSPGNSIGTITVQGNLVLSAASTYLVEIAPTSADRTDVTGAAQLAGALRVVAAPGTYAPGTTYTILTATGGIAGTFDSVTSNLTSSAFMAPTVSYNADHVFFTLARTASFASVGWTRNQIATGTGVDSLGFGNPIFNTVLYGTAAQARQAFDALSGELHASTAGVLVDESRDLRDAVLGRLRQASFDNAAGGTASRAARPAALAGTETHASGLTFWAQGFGARGRIDGDGNAATAGRRHAGAVAGFDGAVDDWRFGFAAGYSDSAVGVDARASSASIGSGHAALYGAGSAGAWNMRAGMAYSYHQIDTTRTVAFPGLVERTTAAYHGGTTQVFGEIGYGVGLGPVALEPFAGAAWVQARTSGFTEKGGIAALTGARDREEAGFATLGARLATSVAVRGMMLAPRLSAAWQHALGDVTPVTTLAFTSGGTAFEIAGAPLARDSALLEAGADLYLNAQTTLGILYQGQVARNAEEHAVRGRLAVRF
ncbi:autotransporter domain-containing protein [Bradyrhizobium sp. AZCC 1693]|uniref:autotransporter domain-containing protein n=1 Tax=Bradyrhizobium sp. AZCC 1693 TaxID=3117029 RepID=UPI002FF265FC